MEPNWANQTIWTGDCLDVMRGMNGESVDPIYLDPPFNSNADYAAPIGSKAAGAEFKDTWGLNDIDLAWHGLIKHDYPGLYALLLAVRQVHGDSMMSYLIYMAVRIMEMKRLLKPTASIWVHCDPTASHYLKLTMDAVFGKLNFRNEIVWCYTGPGNVKKHFPRKHDVLLFYAAGKDNVFDIDAVRVPYKKLNTQDGGGIGGQLDSAKVKAYMKRGKAPESWWTGFSPVGRIHGERVGYPTQKPVALLQRIVAASTREDHMVLDPFCGCATACIAAEGLNRRWAGIDISPKAADLVRVRMRSELGMMFQGAHRTDAPKRTDLGQIPKYNSLNNRKRLYGEQGGYCTGCGEHFTMRHLEIDHIVPRKKGGTDHISNLQLLCGSCNSIKGVRSHEELLVRLTVKGFVKRSAPKP